MKNSKLFLLLMTLSFSGLSFAQKNDPVKITLKDKKGKIDAILKEENLPHFIQFGIMTKNHKSFRNKYKTDVLYENCVISPFRSKEATENNLAIAKY